METFIQNTLVGVRQWINSKLDDVATETNATSNKNEVIDAINNTLQVNMLATGIDAMIGVPMHVVSDDTTTTSYTLNANELYYFNARSTDLNLTLDLTTVATGEIADFHIIIQVETGPLTVSIKDSDNNNIIWGSNLVPQFYSNTIYEIGIINNLAVYVTYDV